LIRPLIKAIQTFNARIVVGQFLGTSRPRPDPECWIENIRLIRQTGRVNLTKFLILPLIAALCAGCERAATTSTNASADGSGGANAATNAASGNYFVPTGPQPKLQTMKLYLGAETLDAEMALTPEQQATGLMYRTNITDETAMLFVLPVPERASFWMTNCPMSESAAYIGPDGVIEETHHFEKNDNVPVVATHDDVCYVLEVNDGWYARHNINTGAVIRTERGSLADTFRK
jgi:uncharacterized protein